MLRVTIVLWDFLLWYETKFLLINLFFRVDKGSVVSMHGSFVEDFIYRVPRFFVDLDFFEMQGKFIDQLAIHDIWQKGNFKLSEGSPGMSRIYLIKTYGFNALTHESIRNIPLNKGRSIDSLKKQGQDVYTSIKELYIQK